MGEAILRMPRLGETMDEGEIAAWSVSPGDVFERGDVLVEFETDKSVVELPALGAGTLLETLAAAGDTVAVGAPIARIELGDVPDWTGDATGGEGDPSEADPSEDASRKRSIEKSTAPARSAGSGEDAAAEQGTTPGPSVASRRNGVSDSAESVTPDEGASTAIGTSARDDGARRGAGEKASVGGADEADDTFGTIANATDEPVRATPAARRVARARGIALETLAGSGRGGRVEVRDVEQRSGTRGGTPGARGDAVAAIPGSRSFAFDGWHVALAGPEGGTPVLLLHGFAGDHATWAPVAHALAKGGCRVLAADLPGHGASTREARTVDELSAGADGLLAELIGGTPVHLVAHSLGAAAALALAERVPSASVSLLAPIGIGLAIDATFVRGMASPATPGELSHLLSRLGSRTPPLSVEAIATLHAELSRGRLRALADALLGGTGQAIDLVPVLERVARAMPTRVLVGHRDRIVDWQDVLRLSPDVAVHHFVDAGHMPHRDDARRVAPVLLNAVEAATTR